MVNGYLRNKRQLSIEFLYEILDISVRELLDRHE